MGIQLRSRSILLLASLVIGAGCETTKVHRLRVSHHSSVSLTSAEADQILEDMGTVASSNDGPGDVPARVKFVRDGDVTEFTNGTGNINSEQDFAEILGLPGQVKVVNQINWCGGLAPNIIGCAPMPGDALLVVRFYVDQEGILWLHEYGHNKGLGHRESNTAVMDPTIAPSRRRLNQDESDAIEQ